MTNVPVDAALPAYDMGQEGTNDLLFRPMTADDIPGGLRLCRLSGWNQVYADWRFFLRANDNGCRVAERGGEIAGTVATIQYGHRFSWLSMLLVDPQERRYGLGTQLLQQGLEVLREEKCCRLDATPAGRQIYGKCSFLEEYTLSRMAAVIDGKRCGSASRNTRPMRQCDLDEIVTWDFDVFGADRSELLGDLFSRAPEYARVFESEHRIEGYMLGRHGFLYDQLGPIVAEHEGQAEQLVTDCVRAHDGKHFVIDTNRFSPIWMEWLVASGFAEQRAFFRMHRGEHQYRGTPEHQFAVVGPEFG